MTLIRTILALICFFSASLQAQERFAFVVGNSNYGGKLALVNPVNDAKDMAVALQNIGYNIYSGDALLDLDRENFENHFVKFARQLTPNSVALLYYAGHGAAYEDDNYLIPINAALKWEDQIPDKSVGLRSIVKHLENTNTDGFNIILLDACRDNPLQSRSLQRGLKQIVGGIPQGTFIGYAASHGQVAKDGTGGRNGIYTGELLRALNTSASQPIETVHKSVTANVKQLTGNQQVPTYSPHFTGEYCFGECSPSLLTASTPTPVTPQPTSQPEPDQTKRINPWMAVLGAVAVGVLLSSGDGGPPPSQDGFTLIIDPPTP